LRTQTGAPNAMARTHKMLKSFTLKFHQRYISYWGNKRGRPKRRTPNLQDINSKDSLPNTGKIVNLDLLSLFLKWEQQSWKE
jgi:hypothetical protein